MDSDRAKPAVPFGGNYWLFDFVLSNLVNAGYLRICVLTQYKSHSLLRHLQRESEKAVDPKVTAAMGDEDLVNALAQYLELEPLEKQALLECGSLSERASMMIAIITAGSRSWAAWTVNRPSLRPLRRSSCFYPPKRECLSER